MQIHVYHDRDYQLPTVHVCRFHSTIKLITFNCQVSSVEKLDLHVHVDVDVDVIVIKPEFTCTTL